MHVVTEFGMVNLNGKCIAERAKEIIALAHPDFREGFKTASVRKPIDSMQRFVLFTQERPTAYRKPNICGDQLQQFPTRRTEA
jgi:acyl-CoA hydrolase